MPKFVSFYFLIEVYAVPYLIGTQSEIISNKATLLWSFTASCGDHLNELRWKKDGYHYNFQDGRFLPHKYCLEDDTIIVYELKITNITSRDSGNYTCYLQYNHSAVHAVAVAAGSILLNVSGIHALNFHSCFNPFKSCIAIIKKL